MLVFFLFNNVKIVTYNDKSRLSQQRYEIEQGITLTISEDFGNQNNLLSINLQ